MRCFGYKRYPVIAAWLLWLGSTGLITYRYFHNPEFSMGFWAVPPITFLFCVGVALWASMESDEDAAWKEMPLAEQEHVEGARGAVSTLSNSAEISVVKTPDLQQAKGQRIHSWNGWRRTIEGFTFIYGGLACMHLFLLAAQTLANCVGLSGAPKEYVFTLGFYLPALALAIAYYFFRIQKVTVYDNPVTLIASSNSNSNFQNLEFCKYQNAAANRIGFHEVGTFQQANYYRTIFLDQSQLIAIEVGVELGSCCFKIISATGNGTLLITSTKAFKHNTDRAVCKTVDRLRGASGRTQFPDMAKSLKQHAQWVKSHLSETETSELVALNEENLKLLLRELLSPKAESEWIDPKFTGRWGYKNRPALA